MVTANNDNQWRHMYEKREIKERLYRKSGLIK